MPNNLGNCLMAITAARPETKPASTDAEKNWAMRPSRSKPARIATAPTATASAVVRTMNSGRLAVGSKISGIRIEATSTNVTASVPVKFCSVTTMAADTLRCAVPSPVTLRTPGSGRQWQSQSTDYRR
jgi:hypothetical protein